MGTHASIIAKHDEGQSITLYQHFDGYDIHKILAKALDRGRERWDDPPYLNRIIFCEMVKDNLNELTGYGIMPGEEYGYNDYELIIDHANQQVLYENGRFDFEAWIKAYGS